jgi:hypothetical protein
MHLLGLMIQQLQINKTRILKRSLAQEFLLKNLQAHIILAIHITIGFHMGLMVIINVLKTTVVCVVWVVVDVC